MKKLFCVILSAITLILSFSAKAGEEVRPLTPEEMIISRDNIERLRKIVLSFRTELYRGRAQNFSAFNLDLNTYIHLHKSPIGTNAFTFNIASDGNQIINGVPLWPVQGFVSLYLTDKYTLDGSPLIMKPVRDVYYFEESNQGHKERLARWSKLKGYISTQDFIRASGKIIAVVTLDVQNLTADFYQVVPGTNELIRAGVFTGVYSKP